MEVCVIWKLCIRQLYWSLCNNKTALEKQRQFSKKFLKGGITKSGDISYDFKLANTIGITKRCFIRSFRLWNEIELDEMIPNYLIYQYAMNDEKSFIATKLHNIVSSKLTVLNFGSCTYVKLFLYALYPMYILRVHTKYICGMYTQLTPIYGTFAKILCSASRV